MARDVTRVCNVCRNHWIAQAGRAVPKLFGPGLTRRSQDLARQAIYQRDLASRGRFKICPHCGSSKVHTANRRERRAMVDAAKERAVALRAKATQSQEDLERFRRIHAAELRQP